MSTTEEAHTSHCDRCEPLVVERNRYFNGKFMTARDFAAEQDFFLHRSWLHNRLFHGSGVVCGFEITRHPDEKNCPDRICVGPGIAIDCCGRELILQSSVVEALPELPQRGDGTTAPTASHHGGSEQDDPDPADPCADEDGDADPDVEEPFRLLLCAHYCEEEIEPVPAIGDDCACDPAEEQANRIRHGVSLRWVEFDPEEHAGCWNLPGGGKVVVRDDCSDPVPGRGRAASNPTARAGPASRWRWSRLARTARSSSTPMAVIGCRRPEST